MVGFSPGRIEGGYRNTLSTGGCFQSYYYGCGKLAPLLFLACGSVSNPNVENFCRSS